MEALITAIAQHLALEGVSHLSLGNVTPLPAAESETIFAAHRHPKELWTQSQISFRLGRALNFAYNAEGLWRFKNKFAPRWAPLYLCATPRLSWATVAGLIQATGYVNLVWSRLLGSWPNAIPTLKSPFPTSTGRCTPGPWFIKSILTAKQVNEKERHRMSFPHSFSGNPHLRTKWMSDYNIRA
jgi:hypothetical protein